MADKQQHQPSEEQQVEQAFLTGFEDKEDANRRTSQPTPAKSEEPGKTAAEQQETKPGDIPDGKNSKAQKPKDEYVRLTKTELEALRLNAGKVPELEKRIETAFGKFGPTQQALNELAATVKALQATTPKGEAVELPADVVSELEAEYPDLAGGVKAALAKALKGLIGTGKSDADKDARDKTRFEEWSLERAREDLNETHPEWQKIVGAVDVRKGEQPDETNTFRTWLKTQTEDYQAKVNGTRNPYVISRAIDRFNAAQRASSKPQAQKLPTQKVQLRRDRLQGSVQPKGLGAPPPAQRETVEDAFASGFQRG